MRRAVALFCVISLCQLLESGQGRWRVVDSGHERNTQQLESGNRSAQRRPRNPVMIEDVSGRPITEILREAKQRSSTVTLDEDFGKDLEEIIASHRQPWNPPSWD